jgi:hypothetical protein
MQLLFQSVTHRRSFDVHVTPNQSQSTTNADADAMSQFYAQSSIITLHGCVARLPSLPKPNTNAACKHQAFHPCARYETPSFVQEISPSVIFGHSFTAFHM